LVGVELKGAGYVMSAIDVNDVVVANSETNVVGLAAPVIAAVEDGAACLRRRSPCQRRSKSILLCPKSSVMKWAISFQDDGDVYKVMSCSLLSIEILDTLQMLEKKSRWSRHAYRWDPRAPSLLQPA
jgi:hypothetical protein